MNRANCSRILWVSLLGAISACAQQTTSFTFDFTILTPPGFSYTNEDQFDLFFSGSAGSLGSATLSLHSLSPGPMGPVSTPIQFTGALNFNAIDSISFSFTVDDPNFWNTFPYPQWTGGTITGGTGIYAGATGSFDQLNFQSPQGSGSIIVGGKTIPLNLTNFNGLTCAICASTFTSGTIAGSTSSGNVTGSFNIDNTFNTLSNGVVTASGPLTLAFNSTDGIAVLMNLNDSPVAFPIVGGTGRYAGATGSLSVSNIHSGYSGYEYTGKGTVTTATPGAPIITQVKMADGPTAITRNGWIEIHGMNLAPPDTPASGVNWSNAPDFANGMMPTSLGAIDSVMFEGPLGATSPAFIYFYCSAATNPNCTDDQINVLTPPNLPQNVLRLIATRNGVASAPFLVTSNTFSPSFPLFDARGHVVATHLDYSLVGPATLFPGASTPAKAGETIVMFAFGFGAPGTVVPGSATQTGTIPNPIYCWISGFAAPKASAALISPGLFQVNLTIPSQVPSGENAIACGLGATVNSVFSTTPFLPGAIITIQ